MERLDPDRIRCFFYLENEPSVGSRMEMELTLPEELTGRVASKLVCQAEVLEVQTKRPNGRTGVLCTVENYRVVAIAEDEGMVG